MALETGTAASPALSPPAGRSFSARQMAPSLIVNAVCPYLLFQVLSSHGVPTVPALCWTSVFPLASTLGNWLRTRHADGLGVISLVLIAVGIATSLISGSVRFLLVKESLLTGLFGLVCLGSLLAPRPLMFYFGRSFATGGDPARVAWWNGLWQYAGFRHTQRLITAAWGGAYVVEAVVRVILSFLLPPAAMLTVSPLLALAVTFALISWTMAYSRRAAARGAARLGSLAPPAAG